ncbi:FAD/NAD(P)-binding protein [Staphylococcus simiae]|uniref:FAD/NAD(P)-binding protein n=1 Tax=Staphylococcus simiae TaxID=308354 RepID=UPI000B94F82B|nr:FAD/NAD(P)-binding protein [Staphylococcus simiae]PNZ13816.1 pyridine nucleotide-disulfide oxidoreductase [Staphylococcus simiae]SNV65907.1 pyridine nucleotide-disulfide oxidoreductase family protein [Staphylococcus simiae]
MHWTIIGGGVQGTTIALKLLSLGLSIHKLSIIDPHDSFCQRFVDYAHRIEMPYLRSPIVHHVHPQPFHLKQFAKTNQYTNAFYGPYQRPELNMFINHVKQSVSNVDLIQCHIKDSVVGIAQYKDQWHLTLKNHQQIITDCVILAIGSTNTLHIPDVLLNKTNVNHIFDCHINDDIYPNVDHIVGSGITAAHLSLKLLKQNYDKTIHLWLNKDFEIHDFDGDPAWLGPKNMAPFLKIKSMQQRYQILMQEKHPGSMPHELYLRLKKHIKNGSIVIHRTPIKSIDSINHQIITDDEKVNYHHILVATGFERNFMNQPLVKQLVNNCHAPLNDCHYPSLNHELEWLPNLFVAGCFADLELGPFARNIMGGRKAAERLEQAFNKRHQHSA